MNNEGFRMDPEKNTPLIFSTSGATFEDLLSLACSAADADRTSVAGWSMEVWDPQPAVTGGLGGELIFSGRLDNLAMCHAALKALLSAGEGPCTTLLTLFNS